MSDDLDVSGLVLPDGKLTCGAAVRQFLLGLVGKRVRIQVEEETEDYEGAARRYYFKVIVGMVRLALIDAGNVGVTKAYVHELLKKHAGGLSEPIYDAHGAVIDEKPGSTRRFDGMCWSVYNTQCIAFAAEHFGLSIPEPVRDDEQAAV